MKEMRKLYLLPLLTCLLLTAGPGIMTRAAETPLLSVEAGGHTAAARTVLFRTHNGRPELISVGNDKAIRLWDALQGRQLRTLRPYSEWGPTGWIYTAALSPDGKTLAVAGLDGFNARGKIRLFNLDTGEVDAVFADMGNTIDTLAYSSNGDWLAAGSPDPKDNLRLFDVRAHRSIALKGHVKGVNVVAFAPDGKLASASQDGIVNIWDVTANGGKVTKTLKQEAEVRSLAWSPDSATLATGAQNGAVSLWSAGDWQRRSLPAQRNAVLSLAFDRQGRLLSGQGETDRGDTTVRLWNGTDGALLQEFKGHEESVLSVAFSADDKLAASSDSNGVIYIWNTTGGPGRKLAGTGTPLTGVAWSKEPGARLVAWSDRPDATHNTAPSVNHTFNLIGAAPGPPPAPNGDWQGAILDGPNGLSIAAAPDGLNIIVSKNGKELRRIVLSKGAAAVSIDGVQMSREKYQDQFDKIQSLTLTPDGNSIIVGSTFRLRQFDLNGSQTREFLGHAGDVRAIAVSPDGRYLASASADETLRLWDLQKGGKTAYALLNYFEDRGGRWITWVNQGYFAASPGGDSLIGWQVNHGPDQAASFYRAEQFWRQFYRPDILTRVVAADSVTTAVQQADAIAHTQTDPQKTVPNLPTMAPPRVTIAAPNEGEASVSDTVRLRARIVDPNGRKISKINVAVNAARGRNLDFDAPQAGVEWTQDVQLQPGTNVITVVAVNDAGSQSEPVSLTVLYNPPVPPRPSLYLLTIGVSNYPASAQVNALSYAHKDALDFAHAYDAQAGLLFDRVAYTRTLTNGEATGARIRQEVTALAKQGVKINDYVIVFLAGHGGPIDARNDNRSYCFLPSDAVRLSLDTTGVPGTDVLNALSQLTCNVILIMDTCRDGSSMLRADDPNLQQQFLASKVKYGRVTIYACQPTEKSQESDALQNGVFTRKFIEGISGGASASATTQDITLSDMEYFLSMAVPEATHQGQHPVVFVPDYITLIKNLFPLARKR